MEMKQRIIGIIVLVALAILLVPLIFDSEVALPPPNHLPVANAPPIKNQQKTVAYQAPTIKPAQIQESSDKTLLHSTKDLTTSDTNDSEDHESFATNEDDPQTPSPEDDLLDKPVPQEPQNHPILPKENVVTAKETSSNSKSTSDDLVKEAALKIAIQKENSEKMIATKKIADKQNSKVNALQHREFTLSSDKPKKQNIGNSIILKQNEHIVAGTGAWAIQLGSFSEIANANKLANHLKSKGFNAFTERDKLRNNVHRVLVGPAHDRNTAEKTMAQLKSNLNIQGIVVRYKR